MLLFGWSPFVLLFPSFPLSLPILWELIQVHQPLLVSPSLCSQFHSPVFHGILDKLYDLVGYFVHSESLLFSVAGPYHMPIIIIIIMIIIVIIIHLRVFSQSLVDGFPLECAWQQISSSFQNSSQYSGQSQPCRCLNGLNSFSHFQVLQSLNQSSGDFTARANYKRYHFYFDVPEFFSVL